ncbi:MAG TPA: autotransporter outer membrane beta-barrel domain-containing protein, partial [Cupriavidus sp.]|nr:autotransporter outer membrane beta-barrel domain-containing protein [Cupriavidus sp.]
LSTLVNDPSQIIFAAPVNNTFKTLTVQNYSGNGTIALNTVLASDGAPSDKLVVDGGTATGSSKLRINNAGGAGALTVANGIQVVNATNGGTTAAGAFALDGRAVAGAYEYRLFRGANDGTDANSWYLRSDQTPTPPAPPEPPSPPAPPTPDPLYRPEVAAYLANQRLA